jgi:S-adenosylmethionine decarboxylase proenzyme
MAQSSQFRVVVSFRFVTLSLLSCILLAFGVGRTARIVLLNSLKEKRSNSVQEKSSSGGQHIAQLPNPTLQDGKTIPQTFYTSRNFNTARSATIISRFLTGDVKNVQQCEPDNYGDDVQTPDLSDQSGEENDDDAFEEDEVHLPSGQHLLLDINHVDSAFLSSEERLAGAMLEIVYECGLTLLSYHCHGLEPSGVSCVGVLLESHVSFHTWPSHGVITLDLFTCGPSSLLPIFSKFQRLFSVPSLALDQSIPANRPQSIWSYKLRGFSSDDPGTKSERTDFFTFPIGAMTEYKEEASSDPYLYYVWPLVS